MHLFIRAVGGFLLGASLTASPFEAQPAPPQLLQAAAHEPWLSPRGERLTVLAPFDLSRGQYQSGHRGIDVGATEGDSIRSPTGGTVSFTGSVAEKPVLSIQVDHRTVLSFEPLVSHLAAGDHVSRGELLGTVASGGHCASSCLHLGVRVNGEYTNPVRYFWPKAKLLPWLAR